MYSLGSFNARFKLSVKQCHSVAKLAMTPINRRVIGCYIFPSKAHFPFKLFKPMRSFFFFSKSFENMFLTEKSTAVQPFRLPRLRKAEGIRASWKKSKDRGEKGGRRQEGLFVAKQVAHKDCVDFDNLVLLWCVNEALQAGRLHSSFGFWSPSVMRCRQPLLQSLSWYR